MKNFNEKDFEDTLANHNHLKLTRAVKNLRASARNSGASEMSLDEINAEIAKSRKEKRELKPS